MESFSKQKPICFLLPADLPPSITYSNTLKPSTPHGCLLTGSFTFFAKYTEPLRALEDVISRSSGNVCKYKVFDVKYSGMRDGKTQFGTVKRKKFNERNGPGLAID